MSQSSSKKILVIDDDAMNREVMEAFLLSEDYTVLLAHNGTDGIAKANSESPDAIVVDVRMPDMSGYQVCEQIKQNPKTSHIGVMIITGYTSKENYERAKMVGADIFLTRPFDGDDLLHRISDMVNT